MSRLRPKREQFQPKEICLQKYISCWDSRKGDAPELMSGSETEPLTGLSCFEKFTQTLPTLLNKAKNHYFFPLVLSGIYLAGFLAGKL